MRELTITRPLPPKELSPNARVHWRVKARATAIYREGSCLRARQVIAWKEFDSKGMPWQKAIAWEVFYFPDKRKRDYRNFEQRMKPFYDGLKDAGVIVDDDREHLSHEPTEFKIDRDNPRVEITVREV
jgi:Holliday junction resolvase RusA-like endonuclease